MNKNFLNEVLISAQTQKASDIHFSSGLPPFIRVQGDIIPLTSVQSLTGEDILTLIASIMDKYAKELLVKNLQSDFAYYNEENKTRYRCNIYKTSRGVSAVFRQLNSQIPLLEKNYPEIFQKISSLERGLVLICGPTGSGKSTTLAAIIDYVNRKFKKHLITLEDPIEYVFETKQSLIDQREIGKSINTFSDGLRGALREDPDVIMIGEMRDRETIKMALTAAETGHLVFSTLHTMSAGKTVDRIIDSCETGEKEVIRSMLSTSLQAIILQTLLKNATNTGRVPAYEILIGTGGIRNLIRENKIFQIDSMIETGTKYGMTTMSDYVANLVKSGKITQEEADTKIFKLDEQNLVNFTKQKFDSGIDMNTSDIK